jgi:hypothetical protein
MRGKIRGRSQVSLDHLAFKVGHHQMPRPHPSVRNAAWLDDDQLFPMRNTAHVAKGRKYQPFSDQIEISFKNLFTQTC